MSLPDDYQIEKVSSASSSIKIYIAWDFDGVDELYVWLQNSVTGAVYYQELGDFTVTEDSDGGGVFILVENNQGVSVDVSVARTTPKTQTYDLSNGESLNPEALIATLDKTVKMIQDEAKGYDNQNITSVNPYVVPDKVSRAGKISIFDSNGDPDFDTPDNILSSQIGYAQEWATQIEDTLVSVAAGGNGTTDYSALHHASKASESADAAAVSETGAEVAQAAAEAAETGALAAQAAAEAALDDLVGVYREKYIYARDMIAQITDGATAGTHELPSNKVMLDYLDFSDGVDRKAQFNFVMPDAWDRGQIKYKIHWTNGTTPGTGNVLWVLRAQSVSEGEALDQSFSEVTSLTSTYNSVADTLQTLTPTPLATVGGTPALQDRIQFLVLRNGSSGMDSYTEDARLLGIQIQYKELETPVVAW